MLRLLLLAGLIAPPTLAAVAYAQTASVTIGGDIPPCYEQSGCKLPLSWDTLFSISKLNPGEQRKGTGMQFGELAIPGYAENTLVLPDSFKPVITCYKHGTRPFLVTDSSGTQLFEITCP
jgi:hypothetical protein